MNYARTFYKKPATCFPEALPIGNGHMGAMIYGGCECEKISLNHETLWSGLPLQPDPEDIRYPYFEQARELALAGQYYEAQTLLNQHFIAGQSEFYLPFGELFITYAYDNEAEVLDYERVLDMEQAICTVSYLRGDVKYTREYFLSYPDNVMAMKLHSSKPGTLNLALELTSQLRYAVQTKEHAMSLRGECPGKSRGSRPEVVYTYFEEPEKKGIHFGGDLKLIAHGGEVYAKENQLHVKAADEVIIYLAIESSFNGFDKLPFLEGKDYEGILKDTLDKALSQDYDTLKKRHIADYQELFGRTRLDLGESGRENLPTDERLKAFQEDHDDNSLYTLLYDFGRYLVIASSRENTLATNLQGIWNDEVQPKWRCNYTVNINTQMNYWPVLMCNMPECYKPLIDFTKMLSVTGKVSAANWYNAEGFTVHHNVDIWGMNAPAHSVHVGFWHGASGWLASAMYEYYEYTQDKEYLRNTGYPLMKEAALFYLSILCDRGDGKLALVPATSPENDFIYQDANKENKRSTVARTATMSDSIAKELFGQCLKAIAVLGLEENEFKNRLENACSKMDPLQTGKDGRLLEWDGDYEEPNPHNRHVSHLYPLHPGRLINWRDTPQLMDACKKTLAVRGDDGTGWSLAWKINFWARLRDGNRALDLLNMQLKYMEVGINGLSGGTYANLFDAHPPFQIDGNFGVVSGMIEMLVGYDGDEVTFLPALPQKWAKGSLTGVRTRGGKVYDIAWENGKLTECVCRE